MKRTSHSTRLVDGNGVGKDGFTDGVPSITPATVLESTVMNSVQEEIARAAEAAGLVLNASSYSQLTAALAISRMMSALANGQQIAITAHVFRAFAIGPTGLIVAVGDGPAIATSDDLGMTWTARSVASAYDGNFVCATYAFGLFIIAGDASGGSATASLQTSPDGITWTQRQTLASNTFRDFVLGGSTLLVYIDDGGSSHTTMTSTNGTSWSTTGSTQALRTVRNAGAYGAGLWVWGDASAGGVHTSPDGATWTARSFGSGDVLTVNGVSYDSGSGMFLAYGTTGNSRVLQSSPDGITWTRVRIDTGSNSATTGGLISTPRCAVAMGDRTNSVNRAGMVVDTARASSDSAADFFGPGVASSSWTLLTCGRTNVLIRAYSSGVISRFAWID
jgi:hypothetical protein